MLFPERYTHLNPKEIPRATSASIPNSAAIKRSTHMPNREGFGTVSGIMGSWSNPRRYRQHKRTCQLMQCLRNGRQRRRQLQNHSVWKSLLNSYIDRPLRLDNHCRLSRRFSIRKKIFYRKGRIRIRRED